MSLLLPAQAADADGTLRKVPFANLIVYLRERDLTGSVVLYTAEGLAGFTVRRGTPVKASSFAPEARLAAVCEDLGFVSGDQLEDTWSVASSTKRLHGQVMVEYGVLARDRLLRALGVQLERKIRQFASLPPDTRFRFFRGTDVLSGFGGLEEPEVSAARMSWLVLRQAPPWAHIEKSLEKCQHARLRLVQDAQIEGFDDDEMRVVTALREPITFDELARLRLVAPSVLAPMVYALLVQKKVELTRVEGGEISQVSAVSAMFTPSGSQVSPAPRPDPVVDMRSTQPSLGAMPIAPLAPVVLSAEHAAFRDEILERTRTLNSQNYFTMLGVDESASRETINGAYLMLAGRWHPDKLPAELVGYRAEVVAIFAQLSEAHQTLSNEDKRVQYQRLVREGGATADDQAHIRAVVEAASAFQKAEVMLKRRDFSAAEEHARRALALDPEQGDHIALMAHLEAQRTEDRPRLLELVAELDRAITKSPRSAKSIYYRAQLYQKLGKAQNALEDFRRVTELDPDHVDAAREVHLAQVRGTKVSVAPQKSSGFFGKLFKK